MFVVCCSVLVVRCLWLVGVFVACCLFFVLCFVGLVFVVCCLVFALCVACWWLLVDCCVLLLIVCCTLVYMLFEVFVVCSCVVVVS